MREPRQGRAPSRAPQIALSARRIEVVRTYLALDDPGGLRAPDRVPADTRFERLSPCPVSVYRRLYRDVGARWYWHDRLEWSDDRLARYLADPAVAVWEIRAGGRSAGYFELKRHDDGSVEIVYFGLTPAHMGRGIGGHALARAVREAWTMGASRVWLHTCTLDAEQALPNYRARGFRDVRTERLEVEIEGDAVVSERLLPD